MCVCVRTCVHTQTLSLYRQDFALYKYTLIINYYYLSTATHLNLNRFKPAENSAVLTLISSLRVAASGAVILMQGLGLPVL